MKTFNRNSLILIPIIALLGVNVHAAELTIEQAEEISKRTGRPILAVAGSKT